MTQIRYNTCDKCAQKDDPSAGIFHLTVTDSNGYTVGHLCMKHALAAMPYANWGLRRALRKGHACPECGLRGTELEIALHDCERGN